MHRILFLLLLVPLTLGGCKHHKYDRTPAGWNVHWEDQGTETTGRHTRDQLFALFDAAMERALLEIQKQWGIDPGYARHKLKENDALYTLVDDYRFPVIGGPAADAPNAQFATGETLDRVEVMALSDYMTGEEWDACFYFYCGEGGNFGESMHKTIDKLLANGYRWRGLDETGGKVCQISSNNPSKLLLFLGNPHGVDVNEILESGRAFVKTNCPDLLEETDEEWASQMEEARKAKA